MIRGLLKLILLVVVVVAIGAFLIGYSWGVPDTAVETDGAVGTIGTRDVDTTRARETGAEIGEKVAVGASEAQRALGDSQLTAKIKSKMALDDSVRAAAIDVDTRNGVVTLSGEVASESERQRALELARETDGVTSVVDRLRIR